MSVSTILGRGHDIGSVCLSADVAVALDKGPGPGGRGGFDKTDMRVGRSLAPGGLHALRTPSRPSREEHGRLGSVRPY